MARKTGNRRSGMFLLELMIAILFFSVASAVCVQVFVKSHQLSLEARQLSDGVSVCSNAAELIRAADSEEQADQLLKRAFPQLQQQENMMTADMDDGTLKILQQQHGDLFHALISWHDSAGEEIYNLTVTRYFPEVTP